MLVLSRKEGEKLVLGDNITLVVSKIAGNRVTIGIEAPADVKIFRGELAEGRPASTEDSAAQKMTSATRGVLPLRPAASMTIELDDAAKQALKRHAI